MIAAERPDERVMEKKVAFTASRAGRPKDTLETPRDVRHPSSFLMRSSASSVTSADLLSELIVRARGSNIIFFLKMS